MTASTSLRLAPLTARALLLASLGLGLPAAAQTTPASPPAAAVPQAVPSGPWSLQQAVEYAVQNNLQVRQSLLSSELTEANLRQSRAAMLPTANGNASQNWNFGTSIDPLTNEFKSQTIRSNNFSLSGQVNLFSGFQVRNSIRRDALDYQASLSDIDKARNDLSLNVASAYLQVLLAEELLRTNQLRVNSTQQQVERTQKLLRAGSVAESNLLDSQAQLASDELNVVTAQNQRDLARLQLTQLLNLDPANSANFAIVTPELPDPDEVPLNDDLNSAFETAQSSLPEVKAAELRVQSSLRGVEVARGAYYPRLSLGGGVFTGYSSARSSFLPTGEVDVTYVPVFIYNPSNPTTPPIPTQFVTGIAQPRFDVRPTNFSDQIGDNLGRQIQFNLNIPILNGFQARTNVQRSQIAVKQAELRREQVRLTLRQSIQQSYADALAAQRRYSSSKRQVEALGAAYRNSEIRFNNGLMNGTDFNIAKNNLNAAESTMIQAKYEYIFRSKVLDFYRGRPIGL